MREIKLQNKVNELIDCVVYLQIMGSFVPTAAFRQIKDIVTYTNDFIENSSEEEVKNKLPELRALVNKMTSPFLTKFPLKKEMRAVTTEFNEFFKAGNENYSYGLEFGWLDAQMDLHNLDIHADTPYHFKIGFSAHKGNGSIEEDFLLKNACNTLTKANYYQELLIDYGNKLKDIEEKKDRKEFAQELYHRIADIKFEVAAYSRLTIISFCAFVESFVNSVGYSYLMKNIDSLDETEKILLTGFKKGKLLQLKSKIEKFQALIRPDKKIKVIISDDEEISENFRHFFEYYEQLKNSSMHYSPIKERIWMKPQDWVDKASEFSKLSMKVALEFWKACYPNSDGPGYLGKLDYNLHLDKAKSRAERIQQIENDRNKWL